MKTKEFSRRDARGFNAVQMQAADATAQGVAALRRIGIDIPDARLREMLVGHAMDANNTGIAPVSASMYSTPSIPGLAQFLQAWLPGFVHTMTAARKIDDLIGISTAGAWEDEEVIQGQLEPVGLAMPYTDHGNIPMSSWNLNWERRTVVRFEKGMQVGRLEEARAARVRVNTSAEKRTAAALALDIQRNRVGFYGYNNGANRTYGFLNDPSLPAYVAVAAGVGGSTWAQKTMLEIVRDIRVALARLRTNSRDVIDPKKTQITLAVPTAAVDYMTQISDFGFSALDWLQRNYPNVRIESAPELDDANGGAGVFYLYADSVTDGSTDDNRTFVQVVPTKFLTLGVESRAKGYVEDYSNATAGVMVKRPYAIVRYTGIV